MSELVRFPPASVQATCDRFLQETGIGALGGASDILSIAVAYGSIATASRIMAAIALTDATACNAGAITMQALQLASQIIAEATVVTAAASHQTSH